MLTIEGFHLWALSLVKTKKEEMPTKNEVERIQNWESGAVRNLCVCMCLCVCVCNSYKMPELCNIKLISVITDKKK